MEYKYTLEKYNGASSRYTCPACNSKRSFTRYVDIETNEHLHETVGRCDREAKCKYHLKPKQYFENNNIDAPLSTNNYIPPPPEPTDYIKRSDVIDSMKDYDNNNFVQFLYSKFDAKDVDKALKKYAIGTYGNDAIFWQIDKHKRIRTGKRMLYNKTTGKRVKERINWMHKQPFTLNQCLFGEHLLIGNNKPVAVVESEKTAVICSLIFTNYIWMASGGLSNLPSSKLKPLRYKNVTLFPDNDGYDIWSKKGYKTSNMLISKSDKKGFDLADYILNVQP